jgi:hypothetical protein
MSRVAAQNVGFAPSVDKQISVLQCYSSLFVLLGIARLLINDDDVEKTTSFYEIKNEKS